jgi:hypothetical protein
MTLPEPHPLLDGIEISALIAGKGFDNDVLRQELDAPALLLSFRPKPIVRARLRVTRHIPLTPSSRELLL